MNEKQSRRLRQRARDDVVRHMRRLPDPPPQIDINVAARHCRRCRLRLRLSQLLIRGIVAHNREAVDYIADVVDVHRRSGDVA